MRRLEELFSFERVILAQRYAKDGYHFLYPQETLYSGKQCPEKAERALRRRNSRNPAMFNFFHRSTILNMENLLSILGWGTRTEHILEI